MNIVPRIHSLQQQSLELDVQFQALSHRLRNLEAQRQELALIKESVEVAKKELAQGKEALRELKEKLPVLARNEEVERFKARLDAMPFELFVARKND